MKQLLPIFADMANGVFAVAIAGLLTNTEFVWWYYVVGILFAMCPDLDAVPELLTRGRLSASESNPRDHREGLHYPLAFLAVGIVAGVVFGFWGLVFLVAVSFHFVNDLYGTGWGIKLLWPFSNRNYKFLGRRANRLKSILVHDGDWEQLPKHERKLRLIVSWEADELPRYISRWGDEDWVSRWYLSLNWISGIEYALFLLAIILVVTTLLY